MRLWPLTAFEHYMYADDRPERPMTFWLRITVLGTVDPNRLGSAFKTATALHPLLSSLLSGSADEPTVALAWELAPPEVTPWYDAAPEGRPLRFPNGAEALDPTRELPLRLFARMGAGETRLWLQIHHAACDALGATRFLEDLLACYGQPGAPRIRSLAPALLGGRGAYHLTLPERRARVLRDLARAFLFFRKFPAPVAPAPSMSSRLPGPASVAAELPHTLIGGLKTAARRRGGSLNDLLLTEWFLVLDAWNKAHGGRRNLRLAMPMSMRRYADTAMPAANVVSMCFLDRQGKALDDADRLFAGIARETAYLKSFRMGYALIFVAGFFGKVRGGMRWLLTPRRFWRCAATAVLSNLGEPFSARLTTAGLTVERLELLPPLRPGTALALGAVTYDGRMALTLNFDPESLGAAAADELLSSYVARVTAAADQPEPEGVEPLLARLVKIHTAKRVGASAFRSWPVGKHVVPGPVFEHQKLLPPSSGRGDQHAHEVRRGDHLP